MDVELSFTGSEGTLAANVHRENYTNDNSNEFGSALVENLFITR